MSDDWAWAATQAAHPYWIASKPCDACIRGVEAARPYIATQIDAAIAEAIRGVPQEPGEFAIVDYVERVLARFGASHAAVRTEPEQ